MSQEEATRLAGEARARANEAIGVITTALVGPGPAAGSRTAAANPLLDHASILPAIVLALCAVAPGCGSARDGSQDLQRTRATLCDKDGNVFCPCINACAPETWCRTRTESGDCESDARTPGFYKTASRPEVYLVYSKQAYCHVQNDDQLAAFGGPGKITIVPSLGFGARRSTGDCGWPNGYFKRVSEAAVYRLYGDGIPAFSIGDHYCHVVSEAQMNAFGGFGLVHEVIDASDLGRGRTSTGECADP